MVLSSSESQWGLLIEFEVAPIQQQWAFISALQSRAGKEGV